ncbi:cytochrome P450 [Karstenula rhodostoma CBS 690.94]|uniref:Cytochrome P450 n=1 Tax=Karstenula rhodostoma CBS 690.94 TaxID=1392251 RepID=A0A9P4PTX9_9PLEO|nr:cytochrome P450 [Karstenula rhodostoma CBS 690.94]
MFTTITISVAALLVTLVIWSLIALHLNLNKARAIGLPILVRYITPTNPLWMAFGSNLVRLVRRFELTTGHFDRFYLFEWDADERYRVHAEFGDAFTLVSPCGNWIYISDPKAAWDVLRRPRDFGRNVEQLAVLNVYGTNLSTTEGHEWQKHRKITAATFTERNNELVWQSSVADDCKTFTLNVLVAALFMKPYLFEGQEEMNQRHAGSVDPSDDSHQYRDSFSKILRGIIHIAVFGGETLRSSFWMPASMKAVGEAVKNFRSYVLGMIEEERSNIQKDIPTRKDLVSSLVRASLAQRNDGRDMIITEQDIISNTFVYGFAGNDTTAITLAHVIMETLRLCHPLGSSSKLTKDACALIVGTNTYTIPPRSNVQVNFCALHTNTTVWGVTAMTWNPKRFIDVGEGNDGREIETEQLHVFADGEYMPWSYGERVYAAASPPPTLAAVLAVLFRKHQVKPVPEIGESSTNARKKAQRISLDIQMILLNEMYKPERPGLRWVEVGGDC